jgi:hypothetical protein
MIARCQYAVGLIAQGLLALRRACLSFSDLLRTLHRNSLHRRPVGREFERQPLGVGKSQTTDIKSHRSQKDGVSGAS